jgi:small subunit ribosomal protein S20
MARALYADRHQPTGATARGAPIRKERPLVANIKSQIKRIRTNEKARLRNKAVKSELRTYVRRVRLAVAEGDKDAATEGLRVASRKLDKAVSKGVIHRNQAANRKSALAKLVGTL